MLYTFNLLCLHAGEILVNKIGGNSFSYVPLIIICEMQKYTKPFSVKINPKLFPKRPSEYLPDAVRLHSLVAFSCWVMPFPCVLHAASNASCVPWPTNLALTRVCYNPLGTGNISQKSYFLIFGG